jgi:predicted Zn-dependent protease
MSEAGHCTELGCPATYFDGQSASGRPVLVNLDAKALTIAAAGEPTQILGRWPLKDLVLLPGRLDGALRLGLRGGKGALAIFDPAFREKLKALAPRLFRRGGFWTTLRLALILGALSAALAGGVYLALPHAAEAIVPFIPPSTEAKLGTRYLASVKAQFPACRLEAPADVAVKHLLSRLLKDTDLPFAPTLDLVDMPVANAFALPGGHVVVTLPLIAAMTSPDELAGVLAHEFGHVIERHVMIGVVENASLNVLLTLVTGGGSSGSVLNGASLLAQLSYSRRLEARADARGLALLDRAKIGTKGLATLIERLEKDEQGNGIKVPAILNSHPPSPEREARALEADRPGTTPAMDNADWKAIKSACVKPAEDTTAKPKHDKPKKRK